MWLPLKLLKHFFLRDLMLEYKLLINIFAKHFSQYKLVGVEGAGEFTTGVPPPAVVCIEIGLLTSGGPGVVEPLTL